MDGDKTFMRITHKDVYRKLEGLVEKNDIQHTEVLKLLQITNGKVKLNKWMATTALTLTLTLLLAVVGFMIKG